MEGFGALHGVLNAAGIGLPATSRTAARGVPRVNDVNSLGTFLGCKNGDRAMKEAGGGSIVNISSVLGLRGAAHAVAYTASKGAVRPLTKNVAMHCAHQMHIRCNSVHPGYIDTPMIAPRLGQHRQHERPAYLEGLHPLGGLGRPRRSPT